MKWYFWVLEKLFGNGKGTRVLQHPAHYVEGCSCVHCSDPLATGDV